MRVRRECHIRLGAFEIVPTPTPPRSTPFSREGFVKNPTPTMHGLFHSSDTFIAL